MTDSLRRAGRGGAGNYHPQPKPPADTPQSADTTRTQLPTTAPASSPLPPSSPLPARSGRGGAGNFSTLSASSAAATAAAKDEDEERRTQQAVRERLRAKSYMVGGRGGAGNWSQDGGEAEKEVEEKDKRVKLDRQVEEAVDCGLKMPERVHERRGKVYERGETAVGQV